MGTFRSLTNQGPIIPSTTVAGSVAATSTGNVTLISSGAAAINVYAYSLSVNSTTAVTIRLMSGSTTAECWRTVLTPAPASTSAFQAGGINEALSVSPPAILFRTNPGEPLTYEKGGSSAANALQHYAFGFWRG